MVSIHAGNNESQDRVRACASVRVCVRACACARVRACAVVPWSNTGGEEELSPEQTGRLRKSKPEDACSRFACVWVQVDFLIGIIHSVHDVS